MRAPRPSRTQAGISKGRSPFDPRRDKSLRRSASDRPSPGAYSKVMRFAVIGVGANVFSMHAPALHQTKDLELVGVSDINPEAAQQRAKHLGCPAFTDHRDLLASTRPEAVAVIAPHPFHAR